MSINARKSLSSVINNSISSNSFSEIIKSSSIASATAFSAQQFGTITSCFNTQYRNIASELTSQRIELNNLVSDKLSVNPDFQGARNQGVDLAWKYERADVQMGGSGSANWSVEQKQEILNGRKTTSGNTVHTVRGAEGHHQKNVADHPEHQANPDNVNFYKDKQEHLQKGHNGSFQNESDAKFIDKDKMLLRTNRKRVITNELKGIGLATVAGFGIGFTISTIVELARVGIDSIDVGEMLVNSAKSGVESGIVSAMGYGGGRLVENSLQMMGVNTLEGSGYLVNYASAGILTIALYSTYRFMKLKSSGMETALAVRQVGKQTLFSLSVLTVSIIAQGKYGGHAGLIVSTSVGLVFMTINLATMIHQRKFEEKLREYTIEQYRQLLIGERNVNSIVI